jgi:hypothetical protein
MKFKQVDQATTRADTEGRETRESDKICKKEGKEENVWVSRGMYLLERFLLLGGGEGDLRSDLELGG